MEAAATNRTQEPGKDLLKRIRSIYWFYVLAAVMSFAVIISRRPDMLISPQFWAEDGRNWYADAYNHGAVYSLLTPENGYLQTFSRITAILSQPIPFEKAPLFFFLAATAVQIVTALFIISPRMSSIIGNMKGRIVLAFVYLALPHSWEVYTNVTNSQWHIALLGLLILVAEPAAGRAGVVFDYVVFVILALSGPFCILLVPIAAIQTYRRGGRHIGSLLGILTAGAIVQGISLATVGRTLQPQLGESFQLFFRIIGRHIFAGAFIGGKGYEFLQRSPWWTFLPIFLVNVFGFAAVCFIFVRSKAEIRLMFLFAFLICVTALAVPAVTTQPGQWETIASNDTAVRYWFIPIFTLFTSLVYFAYDQRSVLVRRTAVAILLLSSIGIIADWKIRPLKDLDFRSYAEAFEIAPAGTEVVIPINPNWEMKLVKK